MNKTFIKNIFLVGSGIAIAASTAIFAMPANNGTSIQANLVNLVQYLGELHITSDGTPNGDNILSVDGSGFFGQNRMSTTNGNMYAIMNGPEGMGPNTEAVGFGSFSGESISNIVGIVNMFGFNQSLMSYSNDALGIDNYVTAYPQGVVMAASGSVGQHGLSITNDGFNAYLNGSPLLTIDNSGNFTNYRSSSYLLNTDNRQGYPFVGASHNSGDISIMAGVLGNAVATLAYQNKTGIGSSSYIMAQPDRAMLGFNADLTNQTDTINEIQVLDYGVVFRFPQASYTFPMNIGTSGQVLATDGTSQLSWIDIGGSTESIKSDKISISASEIQSLNTSPVELIPAPGAGKAIEVLSVTVRKNFNTTPYDTNPTAKIVYPNSGYEVFGSINLGFTESSIHHGYVSDADIAENESIVLTNTIGDPQNGDGTLDIYITYRIITL